MVRELRPAQPGVAEVLLAVMTVKPPAVMTRAVSRLITW